MRWAAAVLVLAGCAVPDPAPLPELPSTPYVNPAEAVYRSAEQFYNAGDFETSLRHAEQALRCDPRHAPAKALLAELQFILGIKDLSTISMAERRRDEIDALLTSARWHLYVGTLYIAEQQAQRVLELAPLVPAMMEIESRIAAAHAIMDWVAAFRRDER